MGGWLQRVDGPPPPAAPRARGGPGPAALLLIGALIGGIAGGGAGAYVASRGGGPGPESFAPLPSAQPVTVPGSDSDIPAVVRELLPTVVTVINKLPNGQPQGSGSGFVVDAQRGYIVTNNHVIENVRDTSPGASFEVVFSNERRVPATLVGRDRATDLAVLQVQAQGLRAAVLGDSEQIPVGATVVAIGSPLGQYQNTVTTGVVSAKGRQALDVRADLYLEDLIQTDAAINPGNSGGPLISAATKQVIGVNTLVNREETAGTAAQGLGFAISSNTVRQIADELIRNGRVERGFIGISYGFVESAATAVTLGLPETSRGVFIRSVEPGSPAAQAGLRQGDVITKLNDQQISVTNPLAKLLLRSRPGDRVTLTYFRAGREQTVELTLGRR